MSLIVLIKETEVATPGSYFVMAQLDELSFPDKEKRSQKQRSQVLEDCRTGFPHFEKRVFKFQGLTLGSRLTLKLGLYQAAGVRVTAHNEQALAEGAELVGAAAQVLKQSIISALRRGQVLKKHFILTDPLEPEKKSGALVVALRLQFESLDDMFYEDVRQVERMYYDPFEDKPQEIMKKSLAVEKANGTKGAQLTRKMKAVDDLRESLRRAAVDEAVLKRQLQQLTTQNQKLSEAIRQKQALGDQAHIEAEVLGSSAAGVELLRERCGLLEGKIGLERRRKEELVLQQADLRPAVQQIEHTRQLIEKTRMAEKAQEKQLGKLKGETEKARALRETVKQQEELIQQLTATIQNEVKGDVPTGPEARELELEAAAMRFETEKLRERLKYVQNVKGRGGAVPLEHAQKLKAIEVAENQEEHDKLMAIQEDLMGQLQRLVGVQENYQQREGSLKMTGNHQQDMERVLLETELKQKEIRADELEVAAMDATASFAKQVAELKHQVFMLDAELNTYP